MKIRKSCCTTPSFGIGFEENDTVFYVLGKALTDELFCLVTYLVVTSALEGSS